MKDESHDRSKEDAPGSHPQHVPNRWGNRDDETEMIERDPLEQELMENPEDTNGEPDSDPLRDRLRDSGDGEAEIRGKAALGAAERSSESPADEAPPKKPAGDAAWGLGEKEEGVAP